MTLGDITNYICTKVGQTDEASVEACQLFVRRRYQMIWDHALWPETLFVVPFTAFSSLEPGETIGVLPASVGQVLGISPVGDGAAVPSLDPAMVMRLDPGAFQRNGGRAVGFCFLSPTCVDYPPGVSAQSFYSQLRFVSSEPADTTQLISLVGEQSNGQETRETIPLTGTTVAVSQYGYANPFSLSLSAACAGTVTINDATEAPAWPLAVLRPGELSLPQRPRVKLFAASAGAYYALAKHACVDLLTAGATPLLRSCENALIAFATGDMLERQRQYAKAQLKLQEGSQLLQSLAELEKNQAAYESRIVPVDVHGAGVSEAGAFGAGGKGFW